MLLLLPTLQLARAALSRWYTWNCSPPYARITSSIARLLVSFAGTKHCCLTAVNRGGALCCPDFPRDRGLKPRFFFPYPAIDRHTIICCCCFWCEKADLACKVTAFFSNTQKKHKNTVFLPSIFGLSSAYLRLKTCALARVCVYRCVRLTKNAYICDLRRSCIFFDIPPKSRKMQKNAQKFVYIKKKQ